MAIAEEEKKKKETSLKNKHLLKIYHGINSWRPNSLPETKFKWNVYVQIIYDRILGFLHPFYFSPVKLINLIKIFRYAEKLSLFSLK